MRNDNELIHWSKNPFKLFCVCNRFFKRRFQILSCLIFTWLIDLIDFLYWNYLILNSHSPSGQPQPPNKEKISPPSGYALETAIANGRRIKETQKFGKEILQLLLLLWLVVSIYFVFHLPSHQEFLFKERETRLVVPKFESQ